jgi:HK97 family phage portal protein
MNPLRRLFQSKTKSVTMLTGINTFTGFDNSTDINNLTSYKNSLYLYIGVSMIAKRVAGIPLELYKIKNKKGDVTEVFDHPLLALLNTPNSLQTGREFMELSITHYLLSGDCFWYLERTGTTITSITPLRPDLVQIVLSPDQKTIVSYEYNTHVLIKFKPEDVLHVKNVDPTNPLRGVGVVRPATSRILTEIEATKYQSNFFKNQGRPDFAVFADQDVNSEQADEFRSDWKRVFGGGKSGQVGVFGRNVKSVQELTKAPKEMDFIETQHFLRDDILAALHIPKAMVTSDDVNLANAKEAYRMYLQEAVVPVLEAFVDVINNRMVPQVDIAVFFRFTDPTPVDREMLLKEHTAGVGKWITQNEARAETDRPALEGDSYDQLGTVSFGASTPQDLRTEAKHFLRTRPLLVKRLKAIEEVVNLTLSTEPKRERNSIFATRSQKVAYAKAVNDKVDRKASAIKDALDTFHDGMLKRILANDLTPTTFMDVIGEKTTAKALFAPLLVKLYKEFGQDALDAVFKKASADQFFTNEAMIAAIEARASFFTGSIVDTTFEILKNKIVDGIANGDGVDKIGQSLRDYFTDMSVGRAKTIARTETGYALSKATNDAYAQSAVITGKEWINAGDDRVRDEHVENGGEIVGKDEAFSNGEQYPGEQSVNCRCVLAPAL